MVTLTRDQLLGMMRKERPIILPIDKRHPHFSNELIEIVQRAKNWPQPMQDGLLPLLQANGFRTKHEQEALFRKAILRAAAIDPLLTSHQRREYAEELGLPNAIRAIWWLRRRFGHDVFEG